MRNVLHLNRERCLACRSCELACAVAHSMSGSLEAAIAEDPAPSRRVTVVARQDGIDALRCEQCHEPLCAFTCKSGALRYDPSTGRVVYDETRCVACYMCLMVCARGMHGDAAAGRMVRCDVCEGMKVPACVSACPTSALTTRPDGDERVRSQFAGHVVVVGSSAAGIAACEAARESAPACSITMVTPDETPQYSRPMLAYALAGSVPQQELDWRPAGYLERDLGVRVLGGRMAARLETERHTLSLDDGSALEYDRLIIATGARAALPAIPGSHLEGVCPLRNAEDLAALERFTRPGGRAVILGGGNVGLQAAEALLDRGMKVTVAVTSAHLLSQMVDAEAGRRAGELFLQHGADVRTRRDVVEILGESRVERVRFDNGEELPTVLVVAAKGIKPNVEWLEGSGVCIGRGVVVDRCGRTNIEGVFAAGDCAETIDPLTGRTAVSGIWPVAYEMGRAAGSTAVGVVRESAGALRMNASRFFGVPFISVGEVRPERLAGATAEVLVNRGEVYRKLVWLDDRLAGAMLYGDVSGAGSYYRAYREQGVN